MIEDNNDIECGECERREHRFRQERIQWHRSLRVIPIPEQADALGAVLSNLDEVLMTDTERAEAVVWAWEGMRAQGISVSHAQVDRNPEGHDPAEGHGRNDESPVLEEDAPNISNSSIPPQRGRK